MSNFDRAITLLLKHEGGYVNDPRDPGGETKYGITKRTYPNEDIKNLTPERAKEIYRKDFWEPIRGDELPFDVAFNLLDGAVNSGVSQSVRWMQRAAEIADDGVIGDETMKAWLRYQPAALAARYNGHRGQFFTKLKTWPAFGKGWTARFTENLRAVELVEVSGAQPTPPTPAPAREVIVRVHVSVEES